MNEETKKCSKCGNIKNLSEFGIRKHRNKYMYYSWCKECERECAKQYYNKHKEEKKKYNNEHKEHKKKYSKRYYQEHKEEKKKKVMEYQKNRTVVDPVYKIKQQMRKCVRDSFRRKDMCKSGKTFDIVGLNGKELYHYLIQTYMNNYGYEWNGVEEVHIDHKTPLSTATTEEDVIKLCHYSNLQLLKSADNLEKSDKLGWELTDF